MRILIVGATGLIGSAVVARCKRDGHYLIGAGRGAGSLVRSLPIDDWVKIDLRAAREPADWLPHLNGIDAVINCAGALQDNSRDDTKAVHCEAPSALWSACEQAGVRRIIHLSAMGVDRGAVTAFSKTKAGGDAALKASSLDWVILRPSVVVGAAAYGGSALFRGLATLPVIPLTPQAGHLDIVQLDDVAETVARLVHPDAPSSMELELAGPDRLSFEQVVAAYRQWLGWKPARLVAVPDALMSLAYRLGDAVAWFGWRPPIRTTAQREIARGATGDSAEWRRVTGIVPQSLSTALAARPASVQERWFARLYLLKPLALATFALFWLLTGLISLGPGFDLAVDYMIRAGAGPLSVPGVIAGGVADMVVAAGIVYRRTAAPALWAAIALSSFYIVAGSILLPGLWKDPLGPMMKIWPILALNLLCLAILDER